MRPTRTKTGSDPVTVAQQLSRSAGQQVSRSAGQQVSRSVDHQISRSAGQQISRILRQIRQGSASRGDDRDGKPGHTTRVGP